MVGALIVVPILVIGMIWVGVGGSSDPSGTPRGGEFVPKERSQVSGRIAGNPDAPVKIVEFADFSCPHCREFDEETHGDLLKEFVEPGLASIEYHYVAFLGPGSVRAAEAAECANDQGAFWEMHDLLFLRQAAGAFSEDNLKDFAREVREHRSDFDVNKFDECLESGDKKSIVEEQLKAADKEGVNSTPTFLINGEMLAGNQSIESMRRIINRNLGR